MLNVENKRYSGQKASKIYILKNVCLRIEF